eukprot:superscaffoldBa00004417_g18850
MLSRCDRLHRAPFGALLVPRGPINPSYKLMSIPEGLLQKKTMFSLLHGRSPQSQTRMRPGSPCRQRGTQRRRRGSVRPEQPERTVTMSFSIGPTESQHQNRAPNSGHTNTDPDRHQLRPPAAGCPGEREGLWHRRTLFWRTLSGVQVRCDPFTPYSFHIIVSSHFGNQTYTLALSVVLIERESPAESLLRKEYTVFVY